MVNKQHQNMPLKNGNNSGLNDVSSLVNWSGHDRLMGKIFYQKFGRVLEEKLQLYEQGKRELKECIRRNYEHVGIDTPKKLVRPAAALIDQISKMKIVNLEESDSDIFRNDDSPVQIDETIVVEETIYPENNKTLANQKPTSSGNSSPQNILETSKNHVMHPVELKFASDTHQNLNSTFVKKKKLDGINEKLELAQRQRDIMLKIKADRVKREREERQQRVEEKNCAKEKERMAAADQVRRQADLVREFRAEQLNPATCNQPKTPIKFHQCTSKALLQNSQKTPVFSKSPNKKPVPPSAKNQMKTAAPGPAQVIIQRKLEFPKTQLPNKPLEFPKSPVNSIKNGLPKNVEQQKQKSVEKQKSPILIPVVKVDKLKNQAEHVEKQLIKPVSVLPQVDIDDTQETASSYDMTLDKVYLPSTEENYNIDDLESGDETDNDEKPRKTIPNWAIKENIRERMHNITRILPILMREHYFGRIIQPRLDDLFKGIRKPFPQRTSSAQWNSPMYDPTPGEAKFIKIKTKKSL